jgi:hypothetical protein
VRDVIYPTLCALAYMHSENIIHRDVKPENTLVAEDGAALLADFGLSMDCGLERPATRLGTLDYMAPEVLRCPDKDAHAPPGPQLYDGKVDSWAVGVLAFEVLVGRAPFEQECKQTTCDLICYGDFVMPSFLSAQAKDFIARALCKNAAARPCIADLLTHAWVAGEARRTSGVDRGAAGVGSFLLSRVFKDSRAEAQAGLRSRILSSHAAAAAPAKAPAGLARCARSMRCRAAPSPLRNPASYAALARTPSQRRAFGRPGRLEQRSRITADAAGDLAPAGCRTAQQPDAFLSVTPTCHAKQSCSLVLVRFVSRARGRGLRVQPRAADDQPQRSVQLCAQQPLLQRALQHARQHKAADDGKALADAAQPLGDLAHDNAAQRLRNHGHPGGQRPALLSARLGVAERQRARLHDACSCRRTQAAPTPPADHISAASSAGAVSSDWGTRGARQLAA